MHASVGGTSYRYILGTMEYYVFEYFVSWIFAVENTALNDLTATPLHETF